MIRIERAAHCTGNDADPGFVADRRVLADEYSVAQAIGDIGEAYFRILKERANPGQIRVVRLLIAPALILTIVGDIVGSTKHGKHVAAIILELHGRLLIWCAWADK